MFARAYINFSTDTETDHLSAVWTDTRYYPNEQISNDGKHMIKTARSYGSFNQAEQDFERLTWGKDSNVRELYHQLQLMENEQHAT